MPQWKSWIGVLKKRLPSVEMAGLPIQRFFHGIAPGMMVPPHEGSRHPITRSLPSASFSTKPRIDEKSQESSESPMRIHRPLAARIPPRRAFPYPFSRTCSTRAPSDSAISIDPSVEPLSAMRISPETPDLSRPFLALPMHRASVSASFRQGMRIVSPTGFSG